MDKSETVDIKKIIQRIVLPMELKIISLVDGVPSLEDKINAIITSSQKQKYMAEVITIANDTNNTSKISNLDPACDLADSCIKSYEIVEPSTSGQGTNYIGSLANVPVSVEDEILDVIENSLEEDTDSFGLTLRNKKSYTVLGDVSQFQNRNEDFSSGSDDIYIPESPDSSSSCGVSEQESDNEYPDRQENPIILFNSEQYANEDLEENIMPKSARYFHQKKINPKKRPRNEQSWKKNSAATARAIVEEYVS
ncbi:unnamed protein product [Euphydryas editha]|uniref:Uncharacterized protein n=1 Tax=Euphydryas editha TaxID=104508 RepID=A0AAU9TXE6_EUPED|nr:unnamed protein product [Euphydryas editha]